MPKRQSGALKLCFPYQMVKRVLKQNIMINFQAQEKSSIFTYNLHWECHSVTIRKPLFEETNSHITVRCLRRRKNLYWRSELRYHEMHYETPKIIDHRHVSMTFGSLTALSLLKSPNPLMVNWLWLLYHITCCLPNVIFGSVSTSASCRSSNVAPMMLETPLRHSLKFDIFSAGILQLVSR